MSDSREGPEVTVGIDIGTTSVKAVAVDEDGTVRARARVPHPVSVPELGSFVHDVDQAWRDDVVSALGQVAGGGRVAAVAVSAMVPSMAAVDGSGRALSPGLLYGDRRGSATTTTSRRPATRESCSRSSPGWPRPTRRRRATGRPRRWPTTR